MRHVALSTNQYASHQIFKLKVQNNKNGCEHLTHNIKEAERDGQSEMACEGDSMCGKSICRHNDKSLLIECNGEIERERERARARQSRMCSLERLKAAVKYATKTQKPNPCFAVKMHFQL